MVIVGASSGRYAYGISYDRQRGRRGTQYFSGTFTAMAGIAAAMTKTNPTLEWEIEPFDPPVYRLVVREPELTDGSSADEQTTTWELHANGIQKDIYQHPSTLFIRKEWIDQTHKYFEQNGPTPDYYDFIFPIPNDDTDEVRDARLLFDLIERGTRFYQASQYVLRRTEIVPETTGKRADFRGVGYVYTTAELGPGGRFDLQLPLSLLWRMTEVPQGANFDAAYTWGWLKQSPTVDQIAGNKWRITQEWWFEYWSIFLYLPASTLPLP